MTNSPEAQAVLAAKIIGITGCSEEAASIAAGAVLTYGKHWAQSLDGSAAPEGKVGVYLDAYRALMEVVRFEAEAA